MDSQRWQKVEALFNEALELPAAQRKAWLGRACGDDLDLFNEVESLLDSDSEDPAELIVSQVQNAVVGLRTNQDATVEGRRIGPYSLVRELGRGGMGAVYLASRADEQYESQVAIKLVKPGLDTEFILKRFRRERQILARLEHPNIARLLDGGTTSENVPYLVMEYIDGAWITKHAEALNLSTEDRLRLFLPVLSAVQYAHRNLIVHRDIKPGNILIDHAGAPKLLDFGISKLLLAETRESSETQGIGMLTPDYASPEQILGETIRIASDIYSLGAVLYELLSGAKPHQIDQITPLALQRAICSDETLPPSAAASRTNRTLAKRLAGDLDIIILRAMQKDPDRRYEYVEAFAEDIRRHLDHRPILARPDSLFYRTGKFVRRNRVAVAFGALALGAMITGTVVSVRQARLAQQRFDQVRQLATTIVFDVEHSIRELPGALKARQLLAKNGVEYLDNLALSSANDWELKRQLANAYFRMGEVQGGGTSGNLGNPTAALASFQRAQALLNDVIEHDPTLREAQLERLAILERTGTIQRQSGTLADSFATVELGLRDAQALLLRLPNDLDFVNYTVVFHLNRGRLRQLAADMPAAAEDIAKAQSLLQQLVAARPESGEVHNNLALAFARMGAVQSQLGAREKALANYRAGVAELETQVARSPDREQTKRELVLAYSHVGDVLGNPAFDNAGDTAGAINAYRRMVALAEGIYQADAANARALSDLGIALSRLGSILPVDEKRTILARSIALLSLAVTRNPKDRAGFSHKAWAEGELASTFRAPAERASARKAFQASVDSGEGALLLDPKDALSQAQLVRSLLGLAQELLHLGDRPAALSVLEKVLALTQKAETHANPKSISAHQVIAKGWEASGIIHAQIASMESGALRQRDRQAAIDAHRKADAAWKRVASLPGFNGKHRRMMDANSRELAELEKLP